MKRRLFALCAVLSLAVFCSLGISIIFRPDSRSNRPALKLNRGDWYFTIEGEYTTLGHESLNSSPGKPDINWGTSLAQISRDTFRIPGSTTFIHLEKITVSHLIVAPMSLVLPAFWVIVRQNRLIGGGLRGFAVGPESVNSSTPPEDTGS